MYTYTVLYTVYGVYLLYTVYGVYVLYTVYGVYLLYTVYGVYLLYTVYGVYFLYTVYGAGPPIAVMVEVGISELVNTTAGPVSAWAWQGERQKPQPNQH